MFYNTDKKKKTPKHLSVTTTIFRTVALASAVSLHLACEILILLCSGICQPREGTSPVQLHLRPKEITSALRVKESPACAVLMVAGVMLLTLLSPSTSPASSLSRGQRHTTCHLVQEPSRNPTESQSHHQQDIYIFKSETRLYSMWELQKTLWKQPSIHFKNQILY